MKLQYFGTAAAEGIPGLFCGCPVCQEARKKKGKYIRTRSQAMVNDKLLIDFTPDTYMHSVTYGVDLSRLKSLLITHIHSDHFYPADLLNRREGYSKMMESDCLTVYGSSDLIERAEKEWELCVGSKSNQLYEQNRLNFCVLTPYKRVEIEGMTVIPLPASHGTANPFVYIIEADGKTMLYHHDSGYFSGEVMEFLKHEQIKFDLVSYDCTWGADDAKGSVSHHLGLPNAEEARYRFIANGNYKDSTISVINHFSHNIKKVGYGDMLKTAKRHGFKLSYDGMIINF